jgi:hypothetical protein
MPIFCNAVEWLAEQFVLHDTVALRFRANARYVAPLIGKLIADDRDGETYRCAVAHWTHAERPPLALYHGTSSFCRIDGPHQWVKDRSFPLGGLILSPGVTAHLNPLKARELHDHMQWAIERTIREWIGDHDLRDHPPIPEEIDRRQADREAKAMIADWAARQERSRPSADNDAEGLDHD